MTITMRTNTRLENEIIIYKEIVYAVDINRKAIKLVYLYLIIIIECDIYIYIRMFLFFFKVFLIFIVQLSAITYSFDINRCDLFDS